MKTRNIALSLSAVIAIAALSACGSTNSGNETASGSGSETASSFDAGREITVVSREDGSGTRGAFIELFGIEQKDEAGNKIDTTTDEAIIANKTDVMLTNVSGDEYAIGYVSLGSINDKVKALKIDGIEATADNVKNGTYKVSRPFNIAIKGEVSDVAQDFIDFILSAEGQEVASDGYIAIDDSAEPYAGTKPAGKVVVAGSSSVSPLMEKLKEAYIAVNPDAEIEIQTNDSTSGMNGTIEGTCDIGMASRDLNDSEADVLTGISICLDGIAVIVNSENPTDDLTSDNVKDIFTGTITAWSEID
ncbi:MAG: substrate-binding domain-containing protein [Candidatus Ornithomonoglobus sp.]